MSRNLNFSGSCVCQQSTHLVAGVGPPDRCGRVMPGDAAAEERQSKINQQQVQPAANEIVDQHRLPADTQGFAGKFYQRLRLKMMGQQRTTYDVECAIPKRQAQGVACNRSCASAWQMRPHAIKKGHLQPNAAPPEPPARCQRYGSGPRSNFKYREFPVTDFARDSAE